VRKYYLLFAVSIITLLLFTTACSGEVKPAKVDLGYVSNEWGGEEVVAGNVLLTVTNPNSTAVTLDSLNYTVSVSDTPIASKTLVPNLTIPPNSSVNVSSTILVDYSSTLAISIYYLAQGKDYVTAHVMAAPLWKLLGGKKPPLWDYPALGILAGLRAGPAVADVKAGIADNNTIVNLYMKLRGTVDAVQGTMDKTWTDAPAGPCVYNVKGVATISTQNYGKSVDTAFDLKYTRQ
jgi:LEA14-like dessication related protein